MPDVVGTLTDLETILASNDKVAIDFSAVWCGPCKMISPVFTEFETKYPNIKFLKIDVDENEDASEKYEISSLPTFVFIQNGEEVVARVQGAHEDQLRERMEELSALPSSKPE